MTVGSTTSASACSHPRRERRTKMVKMSSFRVRNAARRKASRTCRSVRRQGKRNLPTRRRKPTRKSPNPHQPRRRNKSPNQRTTSRKREKNRVLQRQTPLAAGAASEWFDDTSNQDCTSLHRQHSSKSIVFYRHNNVEILFNNIHAQLSTTTQRRARDKSHRLQLIRPTHVFIGETPS